MTTSLLFGLLVGAFCSLHIPKHMRDSKAAFGLWIIKFFVFGFIGWWFHYSILPAHAGMGLGEFNWWFVLMLFVVNWLSHLVLEGRAAIAFIPVAVVAIVLLLAELASWPIFRSGDMSQMIGTVEKMHWTNSLAPIDPRHIRLVSAEQAEWIGHKVVTGGLGSVFQPGAYSLQKVKDAEYYVAPLDFQGLRRWLSADSAPGYILVNAHDPTMQATLVEKDATGAKIELRYTPEAFFGKNLQRHIYNNGYSGYKLGGFHLELDDNMRPWWIVAAMKPTIGFGGDKVDKLLVVDPASGSIKPYSLSEAPAWVDRVVPQRLAVQYLDWWGEYQQGWWKAFIGAPGLVTPADCEMVYGASGHCFWYAGLISKGSSRGTLLSFVMMDSHSGKTVEYTIEGTSAGTVESALVAADNKVKNFAGYHGTMPVPYNIYGHLAYVVPIVGNAHVFEKLAIVDITCQRTALGDDKVTALMEFKQLLSNGSGNGVDPTVESGAKTITVKIDRTASAERSGNTSVYLYSDQVPGRYFIGTPAQGADLLLTQPGDTVKLTYLDTTEVGVPIAAVQNLRLRLTPAPLVEARASK